MTRWNFLDRAADERDDVARAPKRCERAVRLDQRNVDDGHHRCLVAHFLLRGADGDIAVGVGEAAYSSAAAGAAFSAFAVTAMLVMLLGDRVFNFAEDGANIGIGFAAISLAFLIFTVWPGLVGAVVAMGVFGMGFGVLFPPLNALVGDGNAASARGRSYGLFYAGFSAALLWRRRFPDGSLEQAGSTWIFIGLAILTLVATIRLWRSSLPRA